MSANRSAAALIVIVGTLLLGGRVAGRIAPAAEVDRKAKESFELLKKQLPGLVADWAKTADWVTPEQVKTEIKLARFTGPSEAKVTLFTTMTFGEPVGDIPLHVSFYLRYFDGWWTITRADYPPKYAEIISSLMLAIDRAREK